MDYAVLTAPPLPTERTFVRMPGSPFSNYVANVLIGVIGGFALIFGLSGAVSASGKGQPVTATVYLVFAGIAAALIAGAIIRAVYRRRRYGVRTVALGQRLAATAARMGP